MGGKVRVLREASALDVLARRNRRPRRENWSCPYCFSLDGIEPPRKDPQYVKMSSPAALYEERVVANKLEINTGGCSGVLHMKTAVEHAHRGSLNDRIKMQQQSHRTRKSVAGHTWSARKLCEFCVPIFTKSHHRPQVRERSKLENFELEKHLAATTKTNPPSSLFQTTALISPRVVRAIKTPNNP